MSSFDHVEARITPTDADGMQRVRMTYRTRSGFGGMNVERARAVIRNSDCKLLGWEPG